MVVSYTYDPWGAPMSTDGTMAATLGAANPLRYRGYVVLIWVWAEGAR